VGSSESKTKGSFGQKEFYFSNMGETKKKKRRTAQRNTKYYDFSKKINHLPIL
jgi:hypothetical protein